MLDKKDRPILEAVLENAEVIADLLTDDNVLAGIPIIGSAIKICKASDAIKDRLFTLKLIKFITELEQVPEHTKNKYKQKIAENPTEAENIGSTLLLVVDKLIDLEKPQIIAKIFTAYLDEKITASDLKRIIIAIDTAFLDDLNKFLDVPSLPEKATNDWMQYLSTSGLTRTVTGKTFDDIGKIYYEPTQLGILLRHTYHQSIDEN